MSLYSSLTQVLAPFAAKINGLLTGWDGTKYSTPGEAVRQQISDLHVLIGDEPGTAISASAISYGDSDVGTELTNVNGRLQNLYDDAYDRVETDITPSLINDYYIWGNPGASTSGNKYYDGNYVYTDFTEVGNNTWLKVTMNKLSASSPRGIAFYDTEKVYITGYGMNGGGDGSFEVREFEIPDGAVYFRTCFDKTLASRSDFSVKLITEVGGAVLVEAEKARAEAAENALAERINIIETFKTVSAESLIDSKFANVTSGGTPTSADWVCTPHIDMPFDSASGYEIRGTFYGIGGAVIYGESGEVLLGIGGSNVADYGGASDSKLQTITVPYVAGAKTIRISGYKTKVSAASDLWIKGNTFNDTYEHIYNLENDVKAIEANVSTTISQSKVLVMGDSISTDSYGNYKKWVTRLIESGFLPSDTTNSSRHATGFVARYNNEANDFITRLKAIETPSQYDLVVVFGGINDYIQNIPMGEETGTDYTVSFKPAVNEFFTYLIENFTQARICVLLPLRTKATWKNSVNEYEWSYSEYIHNVAKSYCLPVLNLTEESGFCPFISTFNNMWTLQPEGYTGHDGVHPNEEYERRFLAPMIKHFLQGML